MLEKKKLKRTEYDFNKCRLRDGYTHHCKARAKEGQVVFFGDSITEFLNISDWYGDYSLKSGLEIYNRGIGGDTSLGLYKRAGENVLSIKPSCVVMLVGTNDLELGFDAAFIKENLEKTIQLFQRECPDCKIILQGIYPVSHSVKGCAGRRKNRDILKVNKELKALSEQYRVTFVDLWSILADEKGELKKELTYDGLHLSAKGYEVTTREIVKLLP